MEKEKMEKHPKDAIRDLRERLQKSETKTLNKILAAKLVGLLVEEISEVDSVKEWANRSEITESTLHRIMVEAYGKSPGEIQREVRYEKVIRILEQDIRTGAYAIALDTGFKTEDALRMFLRRRYGTNLSKLRMEILSGTLNMDWIWLNGGD